MRFALVLTGLSVALLSGCSIGGFEQSRTEIQSLAPGNLEVIKVSTFNGAVNITAHDSAEVEMEIEYTARGHSVEEAAANCEALGCEIVDEAGRLTLTATRPGNDYTASAAMTLKVPRFCRIEVQTSNGKVHVSGIQDDLELATSNGQIYAEDVEGSLKLKTSNGRIEIVRCTGSIDVTTSNGRVEFDGRLTGAGSKISTSNGAIKIALAEEQLVDLTADTSNGSINCRAEHAVLKTDDDFLHAIVGAGATKDSAAETTLTVESSNGSISISKASTPVTDTDD